MCGCPETLALYCFPCLLLGGDPSWTKSGQTNLAQLGPRSKKHENATTHLDNMVSFSIFTNQKKMRSSE